MFRIICLLIGYFMGCFQTAYIAGRLIGKIDIRDHGSGNAGMTNITRVMGAKAGLFVFVSDILKAVIAYTLCSFIFKGNGSFINGGGIVGSLPGLYAGVGVILGHNFPFFLKFKGGKGIASSIGVILSFNIYIALICYVLGFIGVVTTKYISVASLIITIVLPISVILFKYPLETIIITFVITALAYFQHRENIKRLLKGEENKFSIKKKSK